MGWRATTGTLSAARRTQRGKLEQTLGSSPVRRSARRPRVRPLSRDALAAAVRALSAEGSGNPCNVTNAASFHRHSAPSMGVWGAIHAAPHDVDGRDRGRLAHPLNGGFGGLQSVSHHRRTRAAATVRGSRSGRSCADGGQRRGEERRCTAAGRPPASKAAVPMHHSKTSPAGRSRSSRMGRELPTVADRAAIDRGRPRRILSVGDRASRTREMSQECAKTPTARPGR
jgi:hypothetical protein